MAKIESYPLPPINFGTTIREADRSAVYGIIGKELNSILNRADSYHPDGGSKDVQTSYEDLEAFIKDLQQLQGDVNDPSNILSSVLSDLERIRTGLENAMNEDEARDNAIQMKPEFAPNSSDSNILDPDRFEDWAKAPLAPRNIMFQQAEARGHGQNLNSPNGQFVTDTTDWQNGMFDSSIGQVLHLPAPPTAPPVSNPVPLCPNRRSEANAGPFESAHEAVPFASYPSMPYSTARLAGQTFEDQTRVLRLMPSQQQSDLDSPAVMRPSTDQGAGRAQLRHRLTT